ncbi:hypothetical protein EJ03DRAFT_105797 [Teratosphaeria nubilosa]|uniref:S-adenosyl-L-methionine-dependent methyltransferase n=1 Tax=Teratosphaeria nubilosa TaxID=161662 RepID=A0A6G1LLK0_9PEZI|nr:hypothetical protein EJ03DRAFT_105797 [Teratosphaeria nubilosa]
MDNVEHDWAFDRKFDYIHARMLTLGMHDWPRFLRQAWDHLNPGGWIETKETQFPPRRADGEETRPSAMSKWGEYVYEAAKNAGIDARASESFIEMLTRQGFVNIEKRDLQWPGTNWAKGRKNKILGKLNEENTGRAIPGIGMGLFTRRLGWTKEQVEDISNEVLDELKDKRNQHFYYPMCLHRAQKPENATT